VACPAAARLPDKNKLIRGLPGCRLPKRNGLFMAENFVCGFTHILSVLVIKYYNQGLYY